MEDSYHKTKETILCRLMFQLWFIWSAEMQGLYVYCPGFFTKKINSHKKGPCLQSK